MSFLDCSNTEHDCRINCSLFDPGGRPPAQPRAAKKPKRVPALAPARAVERELQRSQLLDYLGKQRREQLVARQEEDRHFEGVRRLEQQLMASLARQGRSLQDWRAQVARELPHLAGRGIPILHTPLSAAGTQPCCGAALKPR